VEGLVAYWHPRANLHQEAHEQGDVVAYKVEGQVKEGRLTLRPAEADLHDNDELLQQSFFKTEPKGWGRHVVTMAWSWVAKHTHLTAELVQHSWRQKESPVQYANGRRSRRDAANLHQEKVQKFLAEGYQRHLRFDIVIDLVGDTPMTGSIMKSDNDKLHHSSKLVLHDRRPPREVHEYLRHREMMSQANQIGRATRSGAVKLLDQFLGLGAVAETLCTWKAELLAVSMEKEEPQPVKILLYGSTGEGKSALVSALLDMPGIAPSDCAGTAVTSCTMIYSYRQHLQGEVWKPQSGDNKGWAQWLSQISGGPGGAHAAKAANTAKFGAKVHFLTPSAFKEQRGQLVDSIADYWLGERKERAIQAKLPQNDQHEAYFAMQTLQEWYGRHLFAVPSWRTKADFLRHLEQKDPEIEGLQILFGKHCGPNITRENGAAIFTMEENDALNFVEALRQWVTVAEKSKAPFVSHVEIFLPNPALQGVTLIDAAGLGDDNRQRREMAASLVASSDFVWVLAKISRGLSNQLAKKMLRNLSRKVLLDKNSEGEIAFILTHSDVLNESEIAKKGGGSRQTLALRRAEEVPFKFAQDMERELWDSDVSQLASRKGSVLGAFAVSATDYLRVQGYDIYEPLTFENVQQTQIPKVRQQMHMQALKRRCDIDRAPLNQICSVLKKVIAHLSDPGTEEENRRRKCEEIVRRHVKEYQEVVSEILSSWQALAMDQLHNSLAAKIRQGASKGSAAAEATSNEWAVHSNYHHATYKGMVRRGCTWDHPKRGNLDWPEELAEPVYKTFGKNWRDLFGTVLPQQASHVKSKLQEAMKTLHEGIQRDVVQGGCRHKAEVVALQDGLDFSSSVSFRLDSMLRRVKMHSADVTGTVQKQVARSLSRASSKCADGTYAMQKERISQAATNIKFEESATGMVQGLSFVEEEVKHCCAALQGELCRMAESGYTPLWVKLTAAQKFAWQKLQQELLPELKKQLEPLEDARNQVEGIHTYVIKTLKELMPAKAAALAPAAAGPTDDSLFVNFLEQKKPRPVATPQFKRPVLTVGEPSSEQPQKVAKLNRENPE